MEKRKKLKVFKLKTSRGKINFVILYFSTFVNSAEFSTRWTKANFIAMAAAFAGWAAAKTSFIVIPARCVFPWDSGKATM